MTDERREAAVAALREALFARGAHFYAPPPDEGTNVDAVLAHPAMKPMLDALDAADGLPSVKAIENALHAVDDDVQFIRRDARNLQALAARLTATTGDER